MTRPFPTVVASPVLEAYRRWGHLEAAIDPLGRLPAIRHSELPLDGDEARRARELYCGTLAVETAHIADPARRAWVAERMESPADAPDRRRILEELARAELLEQSIQARYTGYKRFSLEGLTALVPFLTHLVDGAGEHGAEQALLAMSHRGRLNVMAWVVGRSPTEIFAGFEEVDPRSALGRGDVKYHLGATGKRRTSSGREMSLHLVSNPSHLEAVVPVAMGRVRAKLTRRRDASGRAVLPIVMHGDAAFAGQGIAAEALNLERLDGFSIGGTVHVVVNNLIGFTTEPQAYGSTRYATDVAKRLPSPIFHVCAEDPDAVVRAARLAIDFRAEFASDVVVDLVGYRRYGHSEIDDPTVTQPKLYERIQALPPLSASYAERAGLGGELPALTERLRRELQAAHDEVAQLKKTPVLRQLPGYWSGYVGGFYDPAYEVDTGVAADELARLADAATAVPEGFHVHAKLARLLDERRKAGHGERPVDFGTAETLAMGSLVAAGTPVRLVGQDTRRGTFNHRHAVWIDQQDEREHVPLAALAAPGAFFEVYDSMLSEAAVLGFEYGFARDYPEALVVWEAQFGDFGNGAQIVIDQFLAAGEDKWDLLSGVVLLLPHGYEGQGPEHSSARLERYLQLAGEDNWQVCQPSTAAQYFHLLRRQALRKWRKPLVVFTPKSGLRHPDAASPIAELTRPRFLSVLPDAASRDARRILLGSGKILHELRAERKRRERTDVAVLGLEQLYPFPERELVAELERHPTAREVIWVQEEPANMGAFAFVDSILDRLAKGRIVRSVKRTASASPATGSAKAHALEQKTLLSLAFA
ncbi:MAG TPA: 2-oxoglutarate dehydrogenase E1 component [Thermoanaerobaculia bacterium]